MTEYRVDRYGTLRKVQRRTIRPLYAQIKAEQWEAEMLELTPAERVARLVEEFDWDETEAWNFIEELIEDEDD